MLTFGLDFEFSGATSPASGTTPWMTVTIDDSFGGASTVRVTITNTNLSDVEFASEVSLNFDPLLDPDDLSFAAIDTSAVGGFSVSTGIDAFQADGDGKFDIMVDLPPPPGSFAARFTAGEFLTFDITHSSLAISAGSFDFFSAPGGGNGPFKVAAHVQGIAPNGENSGWIGPAVPEPATGLLFAVSALAFALRQRR